MNLIGRQFRCTVEIGNSAFEGEAASGFATAVNLTQMGQSRFRSASVQSEIETTDVSGAGDEDVRERFHSRRRRLRVTAMVNEDGWLFEPYVGYYVRITLTPYSPLGTYRQYVGVILSAEPSSGNNVGDEQTEEVTISLNPDVLQS
jgi:hypothetical protein